MPTVLIANTGRPTGSAASRRLRRADQIPGVVYGHGMRPVPVSVDRRELRSVVSGAAGLNTVLDLTVDGAVYPAIIKDLQRHPVRRTISHIDFLQVNLDEEITVSVPLRLEGEATAVLQNNGLVDPSVDSIEVVTTPRNIPAEFVIDVSGMTMDTVIRLAEVPMPAGVTAVGDPEMPVVTVLTMRAEVEEIEAADAELAEEQHAEGEGGEAAESPTSAEGDSDGAAAE
jgi:large subunit ribosomal protein L25